ncbi:DegT/DnrJ/EryC1/StrS aminotransferase family protein [Parabacteroides sp. Marseille-P3160]|uniref:DegT/DnrJ/EryC1/StrS family aminotransferase n=1 Tax=Parabacteroides sp. Marseille-P3160 TaxID=1917887 RepID=UPI0009B9426A|nr:DegT/DnrJ/EryC1/StrS family aminotransferase [Parabacteroides sp. Marseille-P3160]
MGIKRRDFIKKSIMGGIGIWTTSIFQTPYVWGQGGRDVKLPAILGGKKSHYDLWPAWPVWKSPTYDEQILKVLQSGVWSRATVTSEFEKKWAEMVGTKRCLSVVNGTNALITAISQFNIGPGDEVIVSPYTFVATVQAILMNGAIPVFADIDSETFQINPKKIEQKITSKTKAILPVHILGIPADMIRIMQIARKHNLIVIEDACQAHLAQIKDKRVGSIGDAGCFSFQTSKNLPIGEGGAVVSDNDMFVDKCFSFHNLGFPYGASVGAVANGSLNIGTKIRFTEYQAAIGLMQMQNLEKETEMRWENGRYLSERIKIIPGILPCKLYPETTKAAFHLLPLRYVKSEFKNMSRSLFLEAMRAEGVPCSSGYTSLYTQPFIKAAFESKLYQKIYSKKELNYADFLANNQCPANDKICNEEAIWITQNMLLTGKSSMDDIVTAIEKIHDNAEKIIQKFEK